MNHYGSGQIVLNDWTAVRVTDGKGGVHVPSSTSGITANKARMRM